MTTLPSPALAPDVAQRLLADWDRTHEELLALTAGVDEARGWSREEESQLMRLVRHIAVLSSVLRGHHQRAALTAAERAWIETQGVDL